MRSAPEAELNFTAASALDAQSRRNGTPHIMSEGQVKACYGIFTIISSGSSPYVSMLDRFFNQISYGTGITGSSSVKGLNDGYSTGSWAGVNATSSVSATASINSNSGYPNHNKSIGEFGLSAFDLYSNGGHLALSQVGTDKHLISFLFVDSDHKDRSTVYIYNADNDTLSAIDRVSHFPKLGYGVATSIRSAGGAISNLKHGGMSYNASRKELVAVAVDSISLMTVKVWSGVDFNLYPGPAEALAAPNVSVKVYSIANTTSWIGVAAVKPVLTDNGYIYFLQQYSSSALYLYRIMPDRASGAGGTVYLVSSMGVNSVSSSSHWDSPKKMQSRDGSTVFTFSQYYSYGGGAVGCIIDKTKSEHISVTIPDTSTGGSIVPFGDSGWAFTWGTTSTNGSTATMSSNLSVYERTLPTGSLQAYPNYLRPKFPWTYYNNSNTDYPVLFHVADYALLTDQSLS